MNKLKRSLSLRSSKRRIPESVRPQIWENDSYKVRNGGVSFPVKYVGSIEVSESRGTQVCAEAYRKMKETGIAKKKRMQLLVTADCVRVVDEQTKSLVIDQTIEKVSFCTPDPSNDRVFSYICREGTTRRWMCHSFVAVRDTGERLSHAVGCAFTACLQRKQKAQALQQQQKEQQQQQPQTAASTPSSSTSAPLVNGTNSMPSPSPQQPSSSKTTTSAPSPVVLQTPPSTATPNPVSSTTPIASAARPSIVNTTQMNNGSAMSETQQLPSLGQPKQTNNPAPLLKPPPAVARPRPQPFNPSPFTRHMSLRYRSNPLSFMPLRGDPSGYETLTEEPTIPQLPSTADAHVPQSTTPAIVGKTILQPTVHKNTPSQPANTSTAPAPSTLLNLSQAAPIQPYAVPSASNGPTQWSTTAQPQLPPQLQRPRKPSEAEMWLATAAADTVPPGTTSVQRNQGLLTTVNPFAETAAQINSLSNAWTHDLQVSTNPSPQLSNTSWSSTPWTESSSSAKRSDERFASLQQSPPARLPLTRKDSNPFKPAKTDQVFWV